MLVVLIILVSIVWMAKLQWQRYTTLQFQKLEGHTTSPTSVNLEEITTLPPCRPKIFSVGTQRRIPADPSGRALSERRLQSQTGDEVMVRDACKTAI